MNALIAAALNRTRVVLLVFGLCILWGLLAYIRIPIESTPDIQIPIVYVSLNHEGISPEDAERLLLKPMEQELHGIEGIKEMHSIAFEGGGSVILEFHAGFNVDKARANVRDKVELAKSKLPAESKEPTIHDINLSLFPILVIKLSGNLPQRTLYRLSKELRDTIEAEVSSVLKAEIVGDREEVVEILIDPNQIANYGISFDRVISLFQRNNQMVSAGNLDTGVGRFRIKVPGLFENLQDILQVPVVVNGDKVLKLSDFAEVRRTFKDPESFARDRGVTAVTLEIVKRTGENLIGTIEKVKHVVVTEQARWPIHVKVEYAQDESNNIRDMLRDLQNNLILAILLVMAIIAATLGWFPAMIVGIAVPGSFLMGIMVIAGLGLTVNIVVLFSLIFSVGMLVDGAIIVVEYADCRIAQGVEPRQAYLEAAQRMAWPVITSITTILVVFLPLLFWPGVVGEFMKFMPITLLSVLTASILMALFFLPVIGGLARKSPAKASANSSLHVSNDISDFRHLTGLTGTYSRFLHKVLHCPGRILLGALLILIVIQRLYSWFGKGTEFFPDVEPNIAAVHIHARGNLSVYEKDHLVRTVEERILDMPELNSVYSRSGAQSSDREAIAEDVIGVISVEFIHWQERRHANDILAEIEKRTQDIPGIRVEIRKQDSGPSSEKPIQIEFSSRDYELLKPALLSLRKHLETLPGLIGLEDDLPIPGIEWEFRINRAQAAKFGADIALMGNSLKLATNGIKVGTYRPDDTRDEVDILVRYPMMYRNLDQLDKVRVQTTEGYVPISSFMEKRSCQKVNTINRMDGYRVLNLKADVMPGVLVSTKIAEIQSWLATQKLSNIRIKFKGEEEDQFESMIFLLKAFGIAIFLITLILVTQFNSFFYTGLVLSAVVMSTIGIYIGLLIHNLAFGIVMGGIGVIALAGIIVSNNIILIDTFMVLMKQEKNPSLQRIHDIILMTCAQRLRPVILTKLATILGLLPVMFSINIDFVGLSITHGAPANQWWILMSVCIVYGVLFASSLTLFVTPAALLAHAHYRAGVKVFSLEKLLPESWYKALQKYAAHSKLLSALKKVNWRRTVRRRRSKN